MISGARRRLLAWSAWLYTRSWLQAVVILLIFLAMAFGVFIALRFGIVGYPMTG